MTGLRALLDQARLDEARARVRERPWARRRFAGGELDDVDSAALARAIASGRYAPEPASVVAVRVAGKMRRLFRLSARDTLVHAAAAAACMAALTPTLSDGVWSYRRGRGRDGAVRALASFMRQSRRADAPTPAHGAAVRGALVVRRDVRAFGDSVRVDDDAPLWRGARARLGALVEHDADHRLLVLLGRPLVDGDARRARGLPTGSPLHTPLGTLALTPIDDALDAWRAGDVGCRHWGRFGDDVLAAARSVSDAEDVARIIDTGLAAINLEASPSKSGVVFLNGAGAPRDAPLGVEASSSVTWLGVRVHGAGRVAPAPAKARRLVRELVGRAAQTAAVAAHLDEAERRALACAAVRHALDDASAVVATSADVARGVVDDRGALKDLDRRIADGVAAALRDAGARAAPCAPRALREAGLPSLVKRRDRGRGARRR